MKLQIQQLPGLGSTVFALTGQMQHANLAELQSLLDLKTSCEEFVLDLKELKVVDRESIRFLAQREAEGMELRNCPPCIQEWISQEQSRQSAGTRLKEAGANFNADLLTGAIALIYFVRTKLTVSLDLGRDFLRLSFIAFPRAKTRNPC